MSNGEIKSGDEAVTRIKDALTDRLLELQQPSKNRIYLRVD